MLHEDYPFYFDDEDFELISQNKWEITKAGYVRCSVTVNGERFLHRILLQPPSDKEVDHVNGNSLDNRRSNLRLCSHQDNAIRRMMPGNKTGERNVYYKRRLQNPFMVSIRHDGKLHHIGYFASLDEAILARDEARTKLFGFSDFVGR